MPATDMHCGAKPILFERAIRMRQHMTPAEQRFWLAVNKKKLGVKFRNQHPLVYFIADFYCHELRLVVEIDGGYHKKQEQYEYDENRSAEIESWQILVVRFSNEQIENNLTSVLLQLQAIIQARKKTYHSIENPPPR
jgi:very-short-patch-repair endonuclease